MIEDHNACFVFIINSLYMCRPQTLPSECCNKVSWCQRRDQRWSKYRIYPYVVYFSFLQLGYCCENWINFEYVIDLLALDNSTCLMALCLGEHCKLFCRSSHTHTIILRPSWISSGTTRLSWHHEGKIQSGFTGARYSEWQWHHLGHMHICTLTQSHNHASIPSLSFLQDGCPFCRSTNSWLWMYWTIRWVHLIITRYVCGS